MVCDGGYSISEASQRIDEFLSNPSINNNDLIRIIILFALRYETHREMGTNLNHFITSLKNRDVGDEEIRAIDIVLRYGGINSKRTEPLFQFNKGDIFNLIRNTFDKGLSDVTNIYTQHKPIIHKIINDLVSGRLSEDNYPFHYGVSYPEKPQRIIIFILGGITFEEACYVAERNMSGNLNILLGGTSIHNSQSFLSGLKDSNQ